MALSPTSSRASATAAASPATSLPATPATGTQAILTDSTTAPTYQWLMQYDTTIAGTAKWRYLGGGPVFLQGDWAGITSASYGALTTAVSFTAPVAGTYTLNFGANAFCSNLGVLPVWLAVKNGAAATADADGVRSWFDGAINNVGSMTRTIQRTAAASAALALNVRCTAGGGNTSCDAGNAWLAVTPVLLGP